MSKVLAFFEKRRSELDDFSRLGVESFGSLDFDPEARTFGDIGKTPKLNWSNLI